MISMFYSTSSKPSFEYVLMSIEGHRLAYGYVRSLEMAQTKAENLLEDYPQCTCRIYRYQTWDADPVIVEVLR